MNGEAVHKGYTPVMVIFAAQDIYVQGHTRGHGKRVKDVREHLRRKVANLFPLYAEIGYAVRPWTDINDCSW